MRFSAEMRVTTSINLLCLRNIVPNYLQYRHFSHVDDKTFAHECDYRCMLINYWLLCHRESYLGYPPPPLNGANKDKECGH